MENLALMTSLRGNTAFWQTVAKQYTTIIGLDIPYNYRTGQGIIKKALSLRKPKRYETETGIAGQPDDEKALNSYLDAILDKIDMIEKAAEDQEAIRQGKQAEKDEAMAFRMDLLQRKGTKRDSSESKNSRGIFGHLKFLLFADLYTKYYIETNSEQPQESLVNKEDLRFLISELKSIIPRPNLTSGDHLAILMEVLNRVSTLESTVRALSARYEAIIPILEMMQTT